MNHKRKRPPNARSSFRMNGKGWYEKGEERLPAQERRARRNEREFKQEIKRTKATQVDD